jgi:succinate dehydrogenase / fumarate reductase flavoprotein subunit
MGGVKVNFDTQETCIEGLFAAGEAATGLHGANRLGGNSLSDLIVFGKIAGENAASSAKGIHQFKEIPESDIKEIIEDTLAPLAREDGENPATVVSDLRRMMQDKVGIIRTKSLLEEALSDLDDLEERSKSVFGGSGKTYNPGWHQSLEIGAMIDVSRMCTLAALRREESRGGHTREDFPVPDHSHWGKVNSVISMTDVGEMQIGFVTYPPIPSDLKELLDSEDLQEEE